LGRSSSWTRAERQEVFNLVLTVVHDDGVSFTQEKQKVFELLYTDGGCPFDTVPEAEYQPRSFW
jgi:hypothetical protein